MTTQHARKRRPGRPGLDRVPELTHYQDVGCRVWHSCLSCPLARCIYDDPRQGRGAATRLRDAEIARRARAGWSARALAEHYGVHKRSIFRILRRERGASGHGSSWRSPATRSKSVS